MGEALVLRVIDREALLHEHAQNLAHGRAFIAGAKGPALFSACQLLIEHPTSGATFAIECEVVMIMDQGSLQGVALQFKDRSAELQSALADFVASDGVVASDAANGLELDGDLESLAAEAALSADESSSAADVAAWSDDPQAWSGDEQASAASDEAWTDEPDAAGDEPMWSVPPANAELGDEQDGRPLGGGERVAPAALKLARERQQRLRDLSIGERLKVARGPNMEDRILLERIYGANVWEPLLHNPKITVPEVARLAKKGTMPRPLIELIVDNELWIRQSVVRRALLTNPRLSPEGAAKVLRTMSARELKLVPHQTAYPATVRAVAMRLMRGG